jgi:hypothetical protein
MGLGTQIIASCEAGYRSVNKYADTERSIALVLIFTPLILAFADPDSERFFRDSISNYVYMEKSYWYGSLLALAGALFVFNGAKHMQGYRLQQQMGGGVNTSERFGRGYNIVFGLALFGVIYLPHLAYPVLHFSFAGIFYLGCAVAMIWAPRSELKHLGRVLGIGTLIALALYFALEYWLLPGANPYTLLWAEWVGLVLIALFFVADSFFLEH